MSRAGVLRCHVRVCVCEATDSNFFAQACCTLKQGAIMLAATGKYQRYYSGRWYYSLARTWAVRLSSLPSYDQTNTLQPFAINMTQTPIGSRKHSCPLAPRVYSTVLPSGPNSSRRHTAMESARFASAAARLPNTPCHWKVLPDKHFYSTLTGAIPMILCMRAGSSSRKICAGCARNVHSLRSGLLCKH